ncbi:MAG: hypothetical protein HKN46_00705 [Acidimicrobiia bacterium]|nr:hypothetical protein [Acidimicrobiia bacterium]
MHPQFDRQPLQLFLDDSDSGVAFTSAGASAGFDAIGPIIGRGAAAADFDNDGDLDIAVSRIGGQVLLLRNEGTAGHTLTVSLDRPTPGTRLELTLSSGEVLTRWVTAGGSYLSSSDPRVHFGLGDSAIVSLTVLRPGEDPAVFTEVPIDSILRVP